MWVFLLSHCHIERKLFMVWWGKWARQAQTSCAICASSIVSCVHALFAISRPRPRYEVFEIISAHSCQDFSPPKGWEILNVCYWTCGSGPGFGDEEYPREFKEVALPMIIVGCWIFKEDGCGHDRNFETSL